MSEERDLSEVADDINRQIRYLEGSFQTAFNYAQQIGELLTEAKRRLPHGEFGPWIDGNLHCTQRTARNYMKVYQERELLKSESVSVLSDAYHFLIDRKQQEAMDKEEAEREQRQQGYEKEREEREQEREKQLEMFKVRCTGTKPEGWTDDLERGWHRVDYDNYHLTDFIRSTLFPKRSKAEGDVKEYMRGEGIEWLDAHEAEFQQREKDKADLRGWREKLAERFFGGPAASLEDYGLADPELDKDQEKLFSVMEQYLDKFSNAHRKLNAIQNAMIWLRRYGNKMQEEIGKESIATA